MEIVIIMVMEHVKQYTVDLIQDSRFLLFACKKMVTTVAIRRLLPFFGLLSIFKISFYRAMHFSAKRGIAIACRLSLCPSVCPSVRPSVTLVNCDHIGWNSSKIISSLVSLGRSLFATPT